MGKDNPFEIDPSTFMGPQGFSPAPGTPAPQRPQQPPASDPTGIGGFNEIFQTIQQEADRATGIARDATRQVSAVAADTRQSAMRYNQAAQRTASEADRIEAQRAEAARLATSNNPIDRITLIGEQALNPRSYTREGREAKLAEMNQLLAMRGQVHNVKVAEGQARIAAIEANTATRMAQGEGAYDRLQNRITALNVANQTQQQTEGMRTRALSQQSTRTLQTALAAEPDEFGYYQMGDFRYSETELMERERDLRQRKLLASLPITAFNTPQLAAYQQSVVNTMSLEDLETIEASGYVHEGMTFAAPIIEERKQALKILEGEKLEQAVADAHTSLGTIRKRLTTASDRVTSMLTQHGANTPTGQAVLRYSARMAEAQILHENLGESSPQAIQLQLAAIDNANAMFREEMEAVVVAEEREREKIERQEKQRLSEITSTARIQAGGDKGLVPILVNRAMGEPTDPQMVFEYAAERFQDGHTFSRAFQDSRVSSRLYEAAQSHFDVLKNEATQNAGAYGGGGITVSETKELRTQAMTRAWEQISQEKGLESVELAIQTSLTPQVEAMKIAPSPLLAAGIAQGEYGRLAGRATVLAAETVAANFEIPLETFTAIQEGRHDEVDISASQADEIRSAYNLQVTMSLYDEFEAVQPGLGERYTNWLAQNLTKVATEVQRRTDPSAGVFSQGAVQWSQDTISAWDLANGGAQDRQQQLASAAIRQLGDPETMMQVAITMIDDLTDSQKRAVYTRVIQPMVDYSRQNGMTEEETMDTIMAELEMGRSDDPALTQASRKILRALPQVMRAITATNQTFAQRVGSNIAKGGRLMLESISDPLNLMGRPGRAANELLQQNRLPTIRTLKNEPVPWMQE